MAKLSSTQQKFLNEATHLGLETSVVELPKRTVLLIKERVDASPSEIWISAVEGYRTHSHRATIVDYHNNSKRITLRDAGYKMLEWAGR